MSFSPLLMARAPGWSTLDESPTYLLNEIAFGARDMRGVEWFVTAEQGWSSPAPARADIADRTDADGGWDAPTRFGSRVITLAGKCIAPSQIEMVRAKDRFNAIAAGPGKSLLRVEEAHLTRQAWVRRAGDAAVVDINPHVFDWALQLTAPDPWKYADEETIESTRLPADALATAGRKYPRRYLLEYGGITGGGTGTVEVRNEGTAPAGGVVTFYGPVTRPRIIHADTGRTIEVDLTVAHRERLVIDLAAHTVRLNGTVSRRTQVRTAQWFLLSPGANRLTFGGTQAVQPGGDVPLARMEIATRSAWR